MSQTPTASAVEPPTASPLPPALPLRALGATTTLLAITSATGLGIEEN
jgi:hypothetical protein